MSDVEKVARDAADAMFFGPHKPDCEIPEDQTMTVRYGHAVEVIRTALAAMGEREAVAWEHFRDESYFDLWCVRPTGERAFGVGFHVTSEAEAIALVETLAGKASPRPEAVEDGGWQPIATAPRDGTPVLLFVPNGVRRHYVCPESAKQFAVGMCASPNPTYGGPDQWVSVECEDMGSMGGEETGWMSDWEMTPVEPSHWKPLSAPIDIAAAIRSGI